MTYNPMQDLFSKHVIDPEPHCEYYAIGDVHGCEDEYDELIEKCEYDARLEGRYARIVQLGDMIDRGPHFASLIMNDPAHFRIMGNHEYNFVLEHYGYKQKSSLARNKNHDSLAQLHAAGQQLIIDLLMERESYYTIILDGQAFVLSHAPIKDVEHGIGFIYKNALGSIPNYCMRSTAVDLEQLRANHSRTTFVHGHQKWNYHDIETQVTEQSGYDVVSYNIDAGCVYGGDLVALRLRDSRVLKVASKINVDK
jgi:calcineurin-like phosphoesterase family protein